MATAVNLGTLTTALGVDTSGIDKAEQKFKNFGQRVGRKATQLGKDISLKLTAPILLIGGAAAKAAIDFETAFTGVRKTVDATEGEFAQLRKGLEDLALKIPIDTTELFKLAEIAGQLGVQQDDILSFTEVMANLGATTNLSAEEAATSLARFANITKTSSNDFDKLGSTIVDLGNNLATTEAEIVDMSLRLAAAGTQAGLSQAEILGLAGALSSVGLRSEAGGTAFSRVIKEIGKGVAVGGGFLEDLADVAGVSSEEFAEQWKSNAGEAILLFSEGLARAQEEGKNVNLILDNLGFEGIRVSDSLLRAAGSGDKFRKALELGSTAWDLNTALTKEANLRYATTASQLQLAKNRVIQMAVSFGGILLPSLLKVLKAIEPMIDFLKELSPSTKTAIVAIAGITAILGPALIIFGSIATAVGAIVGFIGPLAAFALAVVGIGAAAEQMGAKWESIVGIFQAVETFIVDTFDVILSSLKERLPEFIVFGQELINNIITGIKRNAPLAIQAGKTFLLGISQGIRNNFPSFLDSFTELTKSALITIDKNIPKFFSVGRELAKELGSGIKSFTIEAVDLFSFILDQMTTKGREELPEFLSLGKSIVLKIIQGIAEIKFDLFNSVVNTIKDIIPRVREGLPGFVQLGKDIVNAIISGITSMSLSGVRDFIISGILGGLTVGSTSSGFNQPSFANSVPTSASQTVPNVSRAPGGMNQTNRFSFESQGNFPQRQIEEMIVRTLRKEGALRSAF